MTNSNPSPKDQFKPGQSGNPKGKRPGTKSLTTKVREALEALSEGNETTEQEELVKTILAKARAGDVQMIKLMWNYLEGMPKQEVDMDFKGTISLTDLFDKSEQDD